ncbi:threonine/homoserine/homoserine lactone efflux protein [Paraburkholderia sp. CI3]
MPASTAILTILAALLLGAMSPGPSFVIVARNAIGLSRGDGLATALGMGIGGVFFSGIALFGLYTLLATVEWLYVGLKVAGGVYLVYLASKIWRGAAKPLAFSETRTGSGGNPRKSFWIGLSTQLSNPKTAVYYGSIFAALLPQHPPVWCYFALPPAIFAIEALVHDRRTVLFEPTAARNLSALEGVDRSHRCERGDRAGPAADF